MKEVFICLLSNEYLLYLHLEPQTYRPAFLCIVCLFSLQSIIQGLVITLQFDSDTKTSNKVSIIFSIVSCFLTALMACLFGNSRQIYVLAVSVNALIVLVFLLLNIKPFKFSWVFIRAFKYALANSCKNVLLFITELLGIGAVSISPANLQAVSSVAMSTKLSWQLQSAFATKNRIDISNDEFELKRITKRNTLGSICVLLLTTALLFLFKNSSPNTSLFYFILIVEIYDMLVSFFTSPLQEYLNMQGRVKTTLFLRNSMVILRLLLVIVINNEYALYIAVAISMTYHLIMSHLFYK